jgi:hypothetical protein
MNEIRITKGNIKDYRKKWEKLKKKIKKENPKPNEKAHPNIPAVL